MYFIFLSAYSRLKSLQNFTKVLVCFEVSAEADYASLQ